EIVAIVPGQPFRRLLLQLIRMPQQFRQVVEWIRSVQLAGVDQAHKEVAYFRTVQRFVEERVLAVQNRFFQSTLDDVVVDGNAGMPEKQRELFPMSQQISDGF